MVDFTLIGIFGLGMTATCIQSVLAPFLPGIAKDKGVNSQSVGLIFGVQPLVAGLFSPIFGMLLARIGRKRALLSCAFLMCLSSLSFAFIPKLDKDGFIALGIISRIIQGFAGAGIGTSIVAIISTKYHDRIATIFGIQQTLTGVSMIIGPVLGAGLYLIGGFSFIFFSFSVFFGCVMIALYFLLDRDDDYEPPKIPVTWKIILGVRTIVLDCLVLFMVFGALGALEPILGNFLQAEFDISVASIAYVFIVPTTAYPITVFLANLLLKRLAHKVKMCLGLIFVGFAMVMIGPASFTGISSSLVLTLLSIFLLGSGLALGMVPALPDMVEDGKKQLSQIEPALVSDRVSGLISLSLYFGKATGAPFAGMLKDHMSFQNAMAIVGIIILGYAFVFGFAGGAFKQMAGIKSRKDRIETLLGEKEMVEGKKSFYLLEEDEV